MHGNCEALYQCRAHYPAEWGGEWSQTSMPVVFAVDGAAAESHTAGMEAWQLLEQHAWALLGSGQLRSLAHLGRAASAIGGGLPALLRNPAPKAAASSEPGWPHDQSIARGDALEPDPTPLNIDIRSCSDDLVNGSQVHIAIGRYTARATAPCTPCLEDICPNLTTCRPQRTDSNCCDLVRAALRIAGAELPINGSDMDSSLDAQQLLDSCRAADLVTLLPWVAGLALLLGDAEPLIGVALITPHSQ